MVTAVLTGVLGLLTKATFTGYFRVHSLLLAISVKYLIVQVLVAGKRGHFLIGESTGFDHSRRHDLVGVSNQ